MTSRLPVIVVALVMFGAGAGLVCLLRDTSLESGSFPQRVGDGAGSDPLSSRLGAIDRRLAEIERSLARLGGDRQESSQEPIAVRSETPDLNELRQELEALCDEVRTRMAGLGELQAKKPQPDVSALDELRIRTGGDRRLVADAIRGLTYRDLVLQFGSPTVKFAPLTGPRKVRSEIWLWETPSGDLDVAFVQGAATGASFHGPGQMRKFLEDSGQ